MTDGVEIASATILELVTYLTITKRDRTPPDRPRRGPEEGSHPG